MLNGGMVVVLIVFSLFILTYTISELPETITGSSPAMGNCRISCFHDSDCRHLMQKCINPGSCSSLCLNTTQE